MYNSKECLEILLNTGSACGAVDVDAKNNFRDTPLHEAAWRNSKECIKILLNYGANTTIKNDDGDIFLDFIKDKVFKKEIEEFMDGLSTQDIKEPEI